MREKSVEIQFISLTADDGSTASLDAVGRGWSGSTPVRLSLLGFSEQKAFDSLVSIPTKPLCSSWSMASRLGLF